MSIILISLPIDRYQVLGRVVHMNFVREYLTTKKNVNFRKSQSQPNNIELEVQADTVYIEVCKTLIRVSPCHA